MITEKNFDYGNHDDNVISYINNDNKIIKTDYLYNTNKFNENSNWNMLKPDVFFKETNCKYINIPLVCIAFNESNPNDFYFIKVLYDGFKWYEYGQNCIYKCLDKDIKLIACRIMTSNDEHIINDSVNNYITKSNDNSVLIKEKETSVPKVKIQSISNLNEKCKERNKKTMAEFYRELIKRNENKKVNKHRKENYRKIINNKIKNIFIREKLEYICTTQNESCRGIITNAYITTEDIGCFLIIEVMDPFNSNIIHKRYYKILNGFVVYNNIIIFDTQGRNITTKIFDEANSIISNSENNTNNEKPYTENNIKQKVNINQTSSPAFTDCHSTNTNDLDLNKARKIVGIDSNIKYNKIKDIPIYLIPKREEKKINTSNENNDIDEEYRHFIKLFFDI